MQSSIRYIVSEGGLGIKKIISSSNKVYNLQVKVISGNIAMETFLKVLNVYVILSWSYSGPSVRDDVLGNPC